jgi:SulP family sulfate permease
MRGDGTRPASRWRGVVPAVTWLKGYDRRWLRPDLAAGITLAAYLLPAALGDASLAGLPPDAGLYACLFGGLVFWLFCSSRQTAITITSAISLLIGSTLGGMSGGVTQTGSATRKMSQLPAFSLSASRPD